MFPCVCCNLTVRREVAEVVSQQLDENAEVFRRHAEDPVKQRPDGLSYVYVGRAKAHTAPIVSVQFGVRDMVETLLSVGEDRCALLCAAESLLSIILTLTVSDIVWNSTWRVPR